MYTSGSKTPRRRKPARAVGELVAKVLQPVLSRRTGMTIDLLAAWPELVGEEYRDFTRPQKINWPNRASQDDPFKPGILIVACDGARALYFQHDLSRICARVNVFFGFNAIEKLRIVQKPIKPLPGNSKREIPELDAGGKKRLKTILDRIDDEKLREKLKILGHGVFGKKVK